MTERQFQAKLLKALRAHPALRDAVIFKHSDRINGGIPDISITVNGNTSWFELKVVPNGTTRLQQYYLDRLNGHTITLQKDGLVFIRSNGLLSGGVFIEAMNCIVNFCVNK